MKKSIFLVLFVILSLIFSCSYVMANNDNNNSLVDGVKNTVNNAGDMAEDAANSTAGAIKNGAENAGNDIKNTAENAGNNVKDATQNAGNDVNNTMENMGNGAENQENNGYTATRTATEENTGNTTQNWMGRDIWTWIIVGIITIVIVALIWYYASRNNH